MDSATFGMVFFFGVIIGIESAFCCAWLAAEKGRSKFGWFWIGLCFTFLALLTLAGAPDSKK